MTEPALYGYDLFGDPIEPPGRGKLAKAFLIPPFSVLNCREGFWQERKSAWIRLGIKGEIGRGEDLAFNTTEWVKQKADVTGPETGTSIFDPVLCELAYRWFCPPGGQVVDPFAGGSVRGIVAHELGRRYWGVDLRGEQIDANREQAMAITPTNPPTWVCGDAGEEIGPECPRADFVFSCPPYGDLERYSDDPRDLSNMPYGDFRRALFRIVERCYGRLHLNRFAVFVVGEFRDKKGNYRNFVGDTIDAFKAAGFHYYNEAVLVTAAWTLPVRVTKQFDTSRKMGKTHQNFLVFLKGDARAATAAICKEEDAA